MNYILHPLATLGLIIDLLAGLWLATRVEKFGGRGLRVGRRGGFETEISFRRVRS